jgi:hypothetical protein
MKRALLLLTIAACGADVPAQPTYFTDVQPILRAACARCHGADPVDVRVAKYRLDRYVKDDTATLDAFDYAQAIGEHAVDHMAPAMPPDYALSDRQQEILARWIANGAPKGTRDNRLPDITLIAPIGATTADQSLDTTFRSFDADGDGLAVQLWARDAAGGDRIALGAQTGGGTRTLSIDTGALASQHTFEIYAVLDDGFFDDPIKNKEREVTLLPSVLVDHGARGTAPTVRLVAPNDGGTQIGALNIAWSATDPDVGDSLTIDLALVRYDASDNEVSSMPITTMPLPNSPASFAWTIPSSVPTTDAAGPIPYRIRVTATDMLGMPKNVRSDVSDLPFTIEAGTTTTHTWDDVGPLFMKYCQQCHSQPPSTPVLDPYCFIEYDQQHLVAPCEATDLGVYDRRADIYTRVVTQANMPPASAAVKMTATDRAIIANWLGGGAPFGSGPSDPRPTFVWDAPSANEPGYPVTLTWHAADNEGLTMGKLETFEVTGSCTSAGCCAGKSGTPTVIAYPNATASLGGAMTWMDTLSLTLTPKMGKFHCVQGTVTDTAGQTTTVVNPAGLK